MSTWEDEINAVNEESTPIETTPEIVEQTLFYGNELINVDYLPKIKDIEILKPYLVGFENMNLAKKGWKFQFGTSRIWDGQCNTTETNIRKSKNKNIFVSIEYVKHDLSWKERMRGTILHEISHGILDEIFYFQGKEDILIALDPENVLTEHHGKYWRAVCAALKGEECSRFIPYTNKTEKFKPYSYECYNCGNKGYGDYMQFTDTCEKCGKAVLTENNIE